ncbi:hypothetical protein DFR86_07435 [Acidianus sulfidivorans JP7]|uniref:Uncharacterized protein n=1 Tax=Acidianus sulfidivorans JP7 TaxID=619593 RepID=A0A2U9IN15_9CREN|nr:hypothetical protein [Acidianus sulfidivorans]AWR97397.1 hypothetical protein DFR86_07435 [Acidianus sulfidivorans JP7]
MSEELMKSGERELLEMRSYLFDLLDQLNSLEENKKDILEKYGVNSTLLVTLGMLTMHRNYLDIIVKYDWDNLEKLINTLNSIQELKSDLATINEDFSKIKEAKIRAKL